MSEKKQPKEKQKPLMDAEFIAKYESGAIDLGVVLKPVLVTVKK